jgi:hypothetical protein
MASSFPFATATNRFDPARADDDAIMSRLLVQLSGFPCNWRDR